MAVIDYVETKGMLAKLLSVENVTLRVANKSTASFNIKTRVLTVPSWFIEDDNLADMFIGHEVGHALWTLPGTIERIEARFGLKYFGIYNIIEDIRIERMMLDKYPGLHRDFMKGYAVLLERDFFGNSGKSFTDYKFIDRLNIFAKVRGLVKVPMNSEEMAFYDKCYAAETEEDVMLLVAEMIDLIKKQKEDHASSKRKNEPSEESDEDESDGSGEESDEDESNGPGEESDEDESNGPGEESDEDDDETEAEESSSPAESKDESEDEENSGDDPCTPGDSIKDESHEESDDEDDAPEFDQDPDSDFESETQKKLEDTIKKSADDHNKAPGVSEVYYLPSDEILDNLIIGWKEIQEGREANVKKLGVPLPIDNTSWKRFKAETKKEVSHLSSEFARKQSAFQYSRSRESRSGKLNMKKLHMYKLDDNIFNSVTKLADAKSHGLILNIDYSGSMCMVINDAINQALIIALFCRKVQIPFEVYGFTTPQNDAIAKRNNDICSDKSDNVIRMEHIVQFQLLSSKMTNVEFDTMANQMYGRQLCSDFERLYGTPLSESIILMKHVCKRFKTTHKIQKPSVIFLTDGDGGRLEYDSPESYHNPLFLKVGKKLYDLPRTNKTQEEAMIEMLKEDCESVVNFYISSESQFNMISRFRHNKSQLRKDFRSNGFVTKEVNAYDKYFIINSAAMKIKSSIDLGSETVDVTDKRDVKKLQKNFIAQLQGVKKSKQMMNEFIETIS